MLNVRTILVPTDDSPCAKGAVTYALALARSLGSRVLLLYVAQGLSSRTGSTPPAADSREFSQADYADSDCDVDRAVIEASSIPRAIVRFAAEKEVDLIVMGTRARNWLNAPIGGVTHYVLRRSTCPVLTVRQALPTRGIRRILAPIDFSDPSLESLHVATAMAAEVGAELDVLHVVSVAPPSAWAISSVHRSSDVSAIEDQIEALLKRVAGEGVVAHSHARYGPEAPAIINFALERQSDLLILGTHGKSGFREALLGSVAEAVIRRAPCPALAVRSFGRHIIPEEQRKLSTSWRRRLAHPATTQR